MILDLTLIGLAVTLQPVPVLGFILVLVGDRGVLKGLSFILAWLACLVLVMVAVTVLTGGKPLRPHSTPSAAALAVKLAIGVGLILFGERRRRRLRRTRTTPRPPAWMARLDRVSLWTAAGMGVLLQPWPLVAAGAATVTEAHLSSLASYLLLCGFCLLATGSLLVMELYAVLAPERASAAFTALRGWIERHQDQAIVLLSLAVGLWLVGKSVYQLVT
ncbi:hypothetical protein ABH931_004235 [Streptacidiphilus sp. MAP12-33]|uniref:GAP family protein n=1 Tax=Streptacidiphilus sp. MAP12-33 TaxID=3156266 RepID=UPI003511049F